MWRKNEGTTNVLPNDPLGGTIGSAQYDQWRANFGNTAGMGATAGLSSSAADAMASVPEPSAMFLIALGACVAGLVRTHKRERN